MTVVATAVAAVMTATAPPPPGHLIQPLGGPAVAEWQERTLDSPVGNLPGSFDTHDSPL
jgi:hypothetical protein